MCNVAIDPSKEKIAHTDLTGQFPFTSSQGAQHASVACNFDSDGILITGLKTCEATTAVTGWENIDTRLENEHPHFGQ